MSARPTPLSPLTDQEIAAVRRPYRAASLLPGRAYHDPAIADFERSEWFRRDWVIVGREEDAGAPGTYFLATVADDPLIVVRGRDDELRAFHNVCRHRGTAVVEEPCGKAVRFQCPYHAWIYDLDGQLIRAKHTEDLEDFSFGQYGLAPVRLATWQGFVFVSLDPDAPALDTWLGDLVPHLARFDFAGLRRRPPGDVRGRRELEVRRRELQRVLPLPGHPSAAQQAHAVRPRRRFRARRPVAGRLDGARRRTPRRWRSMAATGRAGRRCTASPTLDERRVYYYLLWPSTFISIHPDYLLVHRLEPAGPTTPGSSATGCSIRRRWPRPTSTRPTPSGSGT